MATPPGRHPLRAALAMRKAERVRAFWNRARPRQQDVRDFLLAYCACFVAVTAFIA